MFKRFFLFGLVNIGIMIMISLVMSLFGFDHYLTENGINYESLMVFCLMWGMGGSFISLFMSKWLAKKMMGVKIIAETGGGTTGSQAIVQTVHRLAKTAGLSKMPEVGIYESPEVNAFATGPSKSNSLVAVSTGLLDNMDRKEIEGVLAHEIAHIANGDMVTMTLIQGVVNAFVLFFAKAISWAAANALSDDDEGPSFMLRFGIEIALQIAFGILGSMVVAWFSRHREFRADAGGAQYGGRGNMIAALERLKKTHDRIDTRQEALATMKISGIGKAMAFLSTHPPLELRIERLKSMTT